jgi:hypothetical protein
MASWQEATAPAPVRAPRARPRPKPRAAPKRRTKTRAGVAGGLAWIVAAGILLAGIVALNVAVLRLNVQLDRVNTERQQLRADDSALGSQLSSASSSPRIQTLAKQSGFVAADPVTTAFVDLAQRAR